MAIIKIRNAAIDLDAAEIPNLPASKITSGTLDNARISLDAAEIPNLDTAKITTGTLADARVPNLNASKITAGTIATARLGSGTASSSTFLRGDNTFAEAGGGKVISFASDMNMADFSTTSATFVDVTNYYVDITPSSTSNNVLVLFNFNAYVPSSGNYYAARIKRIISGGSSTEIGHGTYGLAFGRAVAANDFWGGNSIMYLDSPNTTSSVRYQIQWSNAGATDGAYLGANSSNVNKLFAMELEV